MNKQMTTIIGVFVIVLSLVGIWLWINSTKPDTTEVNAQSENIPPANAELLSNNNLKNLQNRVINGDIPVQVEANYNHQDIFN